MADQTYLVTARKYRPLLFKEVVAQEHVTETLKNAIRLDRLAHAYMFTGPRGVGKTTAARVLAKAINCTTPLDEREDRSEPCRSCQSCRSFEEGRNLNIIEIDAASNNKVDDAREIRETVRIPPQGGRMKVYIIDEVHMVTSQAFNALLKTLEEPPPYVLFIFATTEPHKVIPTIQSRCQRFDFRRIAIPEIISVLREICEVEHITADESSLMLIARKGDGALRDALSVFDQAVSLCGTNLVYEDIIKALGVVDSDLYFEVTDACVTSDAARMIAIVEQIVRSGYDLQEFLDGLAEHLRNLLVMKTVSDRSLIEATPQIQDRYEAEAARFSESILLRLVHIVSETGDLLRNTRQPRLRLEMALLKMTSLPSALDLRTALEKLDQLEKLVSRLPAGETATGPAVTPVSPEVKKKPVAKPPSTEVTALPPRREETVSAEPPTSSLASDRLELADAEPLTSTSGARVAETVPTEAVPTEARRSTVEQPLPEPEVQHFSFDTPALKRSTPKPENVSLSANFQESISESALDTADVALVEPDKTLPQAIISAWDHVVVETMENQIRLGSLLRHTKVLGLQGDLALIGVPDLFHERMLRNERHGLAQRLAAESHLDISEIHLQVSSDLAETLDDPHNDQFDSRAFLKKKCEENPAVKSLVERFGGEIVW